MSELIAFLNSLPPGEVNDEELTKTLVSLLVPVWDEIPGSESQSTFAYKLGRMESVEWDGDSITFVLERHGAVAMGSSRAALHQWTVGFDPPHASYFGAGYRNVRAVSARWYPDEIVADLTLAILNRKEHPHVKWIAEGAFRIIDVVSLVPGDNKQTLSGRRSRFRTALGESLSGEGWKEASPYKFSRD